ncbi:glutathione synthetase [Streptomyces sp. FXJ1.4098]|nr:glutathione synthetase [Streptomyces sp. FXJ1.4098]
MALGTPASAAVDPPTRRNGTAAIVAPSGAGDLYADALATHGWKTVAITLPTASSTVPPPSRYVKHLPHTGSLRRTAKVLTRLGIDAVIAGSADGAGLADQIADRLHLPGNDPASSHIREDIGRTAEALKVAGITAPRSIRTSRLTEALRWAAFTRLPCMILQPATTAQNTSRRLCRTDRDIREAWDQLTADATTTQPLILQEDLPGPQYGVHTLSTPHADGTADHTITAIWSEVRTPANHLCRADLMSHTGLLARSLSLYTMRALTALGVRYGPTISQLTVIADRGPALLSIRTGPHADFATDALRRATNHDPIRDTARLITSSGSIPHPRPPRRRHLTKIALLPRHHGNLDPLLLRIITTLPTVAATTPLAPGATVTAGTPAGQLLLIARTSRDINHDHNVIRTIEDLGLYARPVPSRDMRVAAPAGKGAATS